MGGHSTYTTGNLTAKTPFLVLCSIKWVLSVTCCNSIDWNCKLFNLYFL